MTQVAFADRAPTEDGLTDYDHAHLKDYLRLLDAETEGADWREVVSIIFGLDPTSEPTRTKTLYETHLARARWMSKSGYRHLIWGDPQKP